MQPKISPLLEALWKQLQINLQGYSVMGNEARLFTHITAFENCFCVAVLLRQQPTKSFQIGHLAVL